VLIRFGRFKLRDWSAWSEVPMRSIYELTTEEAYRLIAEQFGHEIPPLDAVENEDWGRDYVLQHFQQYTAEQLAEIGLTWESLED
jgi:hypothetical protein